MLVSFKGRWVEIGSRSLSKLPNQCTTSHPSWWYPCCLSIERSSKKLVYFLFTYFWASYFTLVCLIFLEQLSTNILCLQSYPSLSFAGQFWPTFLILKII